MENLFMIWLWAFFAYVVYLVISESIYQHKKKKVVKGARFNNKWKSEAAPIEWVTVVDVDHYTFTVYYKIDGEECEHEMNIRTFVKKYVP